MILRTKHTKRRLDIQVWGQPEGSGLSSGWTFTGAPIEVSPDFSDQTIECVVDEDRWTPMGGEGGGRLLKQAARA